MSIGGGAQVATASNEATQSLITAPIEGCYMTGVGDTSRNSVSVTYQRDRYPAFQRRGERECCQRRVCDRVGRHH